MEYEELTLEKAAAKVFNAFASIVWTIPALIVVQILLAAEGIEVNISDILASVFKTLLWIILLLKIIDLIEKYTFKEQQKQTSRAALISR